MVKLTFFRGSPGDTHVSSYVAQCAHFEADGWKEIH